MPGFDRMTGNTFVPELRRRWIPRPFLKIVFPEDADDDAEGGGGKAALRNVHEEDAARSAAASPWTSCPSQRARNILTVQEVPNTFLIIPPDAASCTATMAGTQSSGGRMFFWRGGGGGCTSFP